jgi:hypothetical protein
MHSYLKDIVKKLLSRVVMVEDDRGNWKGFQWVSRCEYRIKEDSEVGQAYVKIQLHDDLRPMLLNLRKHFGSVPLLQIAPMPSINSIRVFEILWFTSMKLIKTQLSFWLDDLKKRLALENKYHKFKDFRREILQRAQRDCAEYSPLTFTWTEEKKGRKIAQLHFTLQGNEKFKEPGRLPDFRPYSAFHTPKFPELTPPAFLPIPTEAEPIHQPDSATEPPPSNNTSQEIPSNYKLLEEQGINDEKIQELIAHYRTEVISNNIELIRQKHANGKIPDGKIASWTIKAIQEDWHGQATQKKPYEKSLDAKQNAINKQKRQAEEKQKQRMALSERYNREKAEAIDALLADERFKTNNLVDEQAEFLKQRIESVPTLNKIYLKSGFKAPMIQGSFRHYLAEIYLPSYRNLETWCATNNIDLEKLA